MLNSINSDLIRGHIDTIILSVLREGDRYGYDILGEIEKKSGGQYTLKQPTLYSCLKRLETQGFIYKYWGTESGGGRRTYYSLTEMGKELFLKNKDEWEHSRGVIDMLISSSGSPVRPYVLVPEGEEAPANAVKEGGDNGDEEELSPAAADEQTAAEETVTAETAEETEEVEKEDPAKTDVPAADETSYADEEQTADVAADEPTEETADGSAHDELSERLYNDILAEAESERLLADSRTEEEDEADRDRLLGVSYADRLTTDEPRRDATVEPSDELYEGVYSSSDYFRDYDGEDEDETYEGEEIDVFDEPSATDTYTEISETAESSSAETGTEYYSSSDTYADGESATVTMSGEETSTASAGAAEEAVEDEQTDDGTVFRPYDDGDISEDARREMIIQRGYRNVIRDLLRGEYDGNKMFPYYDDDSYSTAPESNYVAATDPESADTRPYGVSTGTQADFSNLLTAVRSMGDEIRIRTHSSSADKEYNSAYQYYSNKLLLYKYGILFLLMAAEIIIPYLIIKFAVGVEIKYEVLTLVLSITGAAILPIYAVVANMIDPYKRKRYDFSMKNSVLFRLAVMALMLVLIYAVNVVLFMDIAFDAEYAFSLITPALMSTNITLSPIIFQTLYDTKRFNVEG